MTILARHPSASCEFDRWNTRYSTFQGITILIGDRYVKTFTMLASAPLDPAGRDGRSRRENIAYYGWRPRGAATTQRNARKSVSASSTLRNPRCSRSGSEDFGAVGGFGCRSSGESLMLRRSRYMSPLRTGFAVQDAWGPS